METNDPYVAIVLAAKRPLSADDVLEAHALATGDWPEPRAVSRRLMAAFLRGDLARVGHVRGPGGRISPVYARPQPIDLDPDLRARLLRAGWREPGQCRRTA